MTIWEYKIEKTSGGLTFSRLKAIGAEGWELVSVIRMNSTFDYYFKRPCEK